MIDAQYLGDSVVAAYDGCDIELTTYDGTGFTNTIYLEPAVYEALVKFVDRVKSKKCDTPFSQMERFGIPKNPKNLRLVVP